MKYNFYFRSEKISLNVYGKRCETPQDADKFLTQTAHKHDAKGVYIEAKPEQKSGLIGRLFGKKKTAKQG